MDRKIVSVFIASPSDVSEERQVLRDVVNRLNIVFARNMNVQVELLGWEDTQPGFARPQSLINKDVEICQLFIGVLWKRWGSESGSYSSGFEEEFELAKSRIAKGETLDMWLYFKRVGEEFVSDPGKQLKQVIRFKDQLIVSREVLFKEFEEKSDFERLVYDNLATYLIKHYSSGENSSSLDAASSKPRDRLDGQGIEQSDGAETQLRPILLKTIDGLDSQDYSEISFWERLRVHLSSSALFSESSAGQLFGSHEQNLVYQKRKEWVLHEHERNFLIRTHIANHNGYIPGRYWMGGNNIVEFHETLIDYAVNDIDEQVRLGAIKLIEELQFSMPMDFLRALFDCDNENIRLSLIAICRRLSNSNALEFLKHVKDSSDGEVQKSALSAYIDCLYDTDPIKSFNILIKESSDLTPKYKKLMDERVLDIPVEKLVVEGLSARKRIRLACADYLVANNFMEISAAHNLLEDTDFDIRKIAFRFLLENGVSFSLEDIAKHFPRSDESRSVLAWAVAGQNFDEELIPLVLATYSKDKLEDLIEFYSMEGARAYDVFATKYSAEVASRLRRDLDGDFSELLMLTKERFTLRYGNAGEQFFDDLSRFKSMYLEWLTDSAIKGLLLENESSDLQYARKALLNHSYPQFRKSSIEMIGKYGNAEDIPELIELAKQGTQEISTRVIDIILELADDRFAQLIGLLGSDENRLVEAAAAHLRDFSKEEVLPLCEELLLSENEILRNEVTDYIVGCVTKDEQEFILDRYIGLDTYFYDVATMLDISINSCGSETVPSTVE